MTLLHIHIPEKNTFYSLYADGVYSEKKVAFDGTAFTYFPEELVFLYYTYPAHRRAFAVRYNNSAKDTVLLPGLSERVSVLIRCHASKVDKLKKSISFLTAHFTQSPFSLPDEFYVRLHFIIQQQGNVDYEKIIALYNAIIQQKK